MLLRLKLKKGSERRLLRGHDWVYSNELENVPSGKTVEPGSLVHLSDYRDRFLATAYYNPQTLIAARVVSREPLTGVNSDWLSERLLSARAFRDHLYRQPYYRWIHGEADGLPGLVIDRFGEYLTLQISTAGMERLKSTVVELAMRVCNAQGAVFRGDEHFLKLEGLPVSPPESVGDVPELVLVREGELNFETNLRTGQKTGWFYDQRDNRNRLSRYVRGRSVLDVFCYAGAWGVSAAQAGATDVRCLDSSETALELAQRNAKRNDVTIRSIHADAFEGLRALNESGELFDVVVIDPPALIKRKRDFEAGLQAYYQLNRLAAGLIRDEGLLVSCSCSHHLPQADLVEIVAHAARHHRRRAAIVEFGQQSADHPVHPAMPETAYLKTLFVRMSKTEG